MNNSFNPKLLTLKVSLTKKNKNALFPNFGLFLDLMVGRVLIRNRITLTSPKKTPGNSHNQTPSPKLGPLTIDADQMSDYDIQQAIKKAHYSGLELHIKDKNGKVLSNNCESERETRLDLLYIELASNLSSSTEIEKEL